MRGRDLRKLRCLGEDKSSSKTLRLYQQWNGIIALLDREIAGVAISLQMPNLDAKAGELKVFEDILDSVVCAWVGICALEGRAKPFGGCRFCDMDSIAAFGITLTAEASVSIPDHASAYDDAGP